MTKVQEVLSNNDAPRRPAEAPPARFYGPVNTVVAGVTKNRSKIGFTALVLAAAVLAGCGGGGGSSGGVALPIAAAPAPAPAAEDPKPPVTEQPPDKAPPTCSVGIWGDSISALTAPRLPKSLQLNAHSVWGGTAIAAQVAMLQDPLSERFQVIEYGKNDANSGSPYEPAMRAMLDRVKALKRTPVVVGQSRSTAGNVFAYSANNLLALKLAQEYGAIWVDWASVPGGLMADGIHPDDELQQRLADALAAAILEKAPECTAP